jgi:hypothetical protein
MTYLACKCTVVFHHVDSCLRYMSFYFVMIFHHAMQPIMSDVIEWYLRMPQLLKYIHLRHSVRAD